MNTTPIEFMAWAQCGSTHIEDQETFTMWKMNDDWHFVNDYYIFDKQNMPKDAQYLQLTALRSINDEPIYNHQIVKDENCDLYEVDMFNYVLMYNLSEHSTLEIVGNRFQHPELLELCK